VVGAVREYARFRDAGIPAPAQTASLFPREALIGEGLTTLAPILGIAIMASLLSYLGARAFNFWTSGGPHPSRRPVWGNQEPRYTWLTMAAVAMTGVCIGGLVIALVIWLLGLVLLLPVLPIVFVLFWIRLLRTPFAAAVVVFLALAVYGGLVSFWAQLVEANPTFNSVTITRHGLETLSGFYLTRSGGNVYIAVLPRQVRKGKRRFAVLSVPESEVIVISLGPEYQVTNGTVALPKKEAQKKPRLSRAPEPGPASEPARVTTTERGKSAHITTEDESEHAGTEGHHEHTTPEPSTPPHSRTPKPEIHVFALDELVPSREHFCFPIGTGRTAATLVLAFTVPQISHKPFYKTHLRLGPSSERPVRVPVNRKLLRVLRSGALVPVEVAIAAVAGTTTTSGLDTLELQDPGGIPLGPRVPSWEPRSSAECGT
jgi:hypothetical protein